MHTHACVCVCVCVCVYSSPRSVAAGISNSSLTRISVSHISRDQVMPSSSVVFFNNFVTILAFRPDDRQDSMDRRGNKGIASSARRAGLFPKMGPGLKIEASFLPPFICSKVRPGGCTTREPPLIPAAAGAAVDAASCCAPKCCEPSC